MLDKYIKCNIWKLAVRYDIYIYVIRRLKVKNGTTNYDFNTVLTSVDLS